jgi:rSAM/selenodomain-associated transferase 1
MVDLAGARLVSVMTRAPSSGGKTRLFSSLGIPPDRRLLEALLLDTVGQALSTGAAVVVAVTPARACDEVRPLLRESLGGDVDVIAQAGGDLGARMRATMADLFAHGAGAVALIGSDLPHIDPSAIEEAFALLETDRDAVVLGPAADGGYYLVAATQLPPVFEGIAWGTPRVLEQTIEAASAQRLQVRFVSGLEDVDSLDGLRRAIGSGRAHRTAAWAEAALRP